MAKYQIKVQYGEHKFSTFLLQNVCYEGLLSSIRRNCSSLAHLDDEMIRLRYKDEDGDLVNISKGDNFAFIEMLRTAQEVKDRDYNKVFIQANEVDSPRPESRKRRFDSTNSTPFCSSSSLQPKQLAFRTPTMPPPSVHTGKDQQSHSTPLDSKQQELSENLMVLRIQIQTAKEELGKLNEQDKNFLSLSGIRGRLCTVCHLTGHTKTTCKNQPCLDVNICKVRDKHPEQKAKIQ